MANLLILITSKNILLKSKKSVVYIKINKKNNPIPFFMGDGRTNVFSLFACWRFFWCSGDSGWVMEASELASNFFGNNTSSDSLFSNFKFDELSAKPTSDFSNPSSESLFDKSSIGNSFFETDEGEK